MPETGYHRVLNGTDLVVRQFDFQHRLLRTFARVLIANVAGFTWGLARTLATGFARLWWRLDAFTRDGVASVTNAFTSVLTAFFTGGFVDRFAILLGFAEVLVRFNVVVDREVILPLEKSSSTADNLFELDDRVDRSHQHDIPNMASVYASREFLRCCQDRRDRLLIVLKVPQILFAQVPIVGSDSNAVIRFRTGLYLVDQVANGQGVTLSRAENQGLLPLVDRLHEQLDPIGFALFDLDNFVEILFRNASAAAIISILSE